MESKILDWWIGLDGLVMVLSVDRGSGGEWSVDKDLAGWSVEDQGVGVGTGAVHHNHRTH